MPRVSIIIPTFNCMAFLGSAIDSVLAQTYTDYEIIVVDDGSTDKTRERIAEYADKIKYFHQLNQGVSAARNLALTHATGEFIAYLDADDMWQPGKLEAQVSYLDSHKQCGMVHTEVSVIDEDGKIIHICFNRETGRSVPQGKCLNDLLQRCHIQTLTVMERRSCLDKAGPFDLRLPVAQDYMHWIMLAINGVEVGYLDQPFGMYRWRKGSLMSSQSRLWRDLSAIYHFILTETPIAELSGCEIEKVVRAQYYKHRRSLAYLDRIEGRDSLAVGNLFNLIREYPFKVELYVDLFKAFIWNARSVKSKVSNTTP